MRRILVLIILLLECALVEAPGSSNAAPAPPFPQRMTISDVTPSPGEAIDLWFLDRPTHRYKIFIDTRTNALATVTTSPTGHAHLRFTFSRYAKVGSRHTLGVYDPSTGVAGWHVINVVAR